MIEEKGGMSLMRTLKKIEGECLKRDKRVESKETKNGKKGEINLKIDKQIGRMIGVLIEVPMIGLIK